MLAVNSPRRAPLHFQEINTPLRVAAQSAQTGAEQAAHARSAPTAKVITGFLGAGKTRLIICRAAKRTTLRAKIRKARRVAAVLKAEMGTIDPLILLGLGIGAKNELDTRHEVHHHHHHDDNHSSDDQHHDHTYEQSHDEFDSFVFELPEITAPNTAVEKIADVIRRFGALCLKGFAAVAGKPMRLGIQAIGPRFDSAFDRPLTVEKPRATRLVVIGEAGPARAGIDHATTDRAGIEAGLKA